MVVRYFGGTKLGVPGLINAYKTAARLALDAAEIVEEEIRETITFTFDYPDLNEVMRIAKAFNANIEAQEMMNQVTMRLALTEDALKLMHAQLIMLKSITFSE